MADWLNEAESVFGTPTPTSTATPSPVVSEGGAASWIPTLQGVAQESTGLAGGLVGAKAGAAAGLPLAPFTWGLSVPAGSILGGALGYFGGSTLGGLAGKTAAGEEADLMQVAEQQVAPTITGAGIETVLSGLGAGGRLLAPVFSETGKGLLRKALGARVSDYGKFAKNSIIETVDGSFETQTKKSLDNVIEKNVLGKSLDAAEQFGNLQAAKEGVEEQIQTVLREAEKKAGKIPNPSFDNALNYIKEKIGADEVDKYLNRVTSFSDALTREGQGSLVYLNQQKKVVGENWKNSPESDPGFWRALYKDMKEHIETYAPQVKALNQDKLDLLVVEPIIKRGLAQGEAAFDVNRVLKQLYTTGGAGLAGGLALGTVMGDPALGVTGAAGLAALATPRGQRLLGSLLKSASRFESPISAGDIAAVSRGLVSSLQATPESVPQILPESPSALAGMTDSSDWMTDAEDLFATTTPTKPATTTKIGKQNVSIPSGEQYAPADLVKAVIKVESAGKPDAVSGKGARGLMQLMPGTAKELGVDPSDPTENVEGGSRYLQQQIDKFGSRELALAAYNWGPANVQRAIDKIKADGKKPTWELVKQYVKVPKETRNYVDRVLSFI